MHLPITMGYDLINRETTRTDAGRYTTTMTYDSRGNVLTRTAPAPLSYVEVSTYDALSNLLSYRNGRGATTLLRWSRRSAAFFIALSRINLPG
jgi:YD repeat-containing protein